MPCNKLKALIITTLLASLLGGCNSAQVRRAEPVQVQLPSAKPQQRQYGEEIQQRYQQAIAQLRAGQTEAASQTLVELLKLRADIPGAWYNLALIHYQQQRLDDALQSLNQCLELSPRNAAAHTLQGLILRQQGQFENARIAYSKALKSNENYAAAHLNIAILYDIYLQYLDDAQHHYSRYLELNANAPDAPQVTLWLQDLQRRLQQEAKG